MQLKKFILFGLLISTTLLHAQTDFRSGYIINLSGDTIHGKIDYRGDLLMNRICKFKNNDTIKEYSPYDITAFRFNNSKYYVSKEIKGVSVFLEYLIKGKVDIFYMRDNQGSHYYLGKENERLSEIPYEEGTKFVDKKEVFYESKTHIGILRYYMQDAPGFQSKINNIEKPEHNNLIKLAEDYHNAVCDGEKCIIYEKKQPLFKVSLEPVVGLINYNNIHKLNDKTYLQGGILANIWMPTANEKLYFRTGVLYSQIEYEVEKENIYQFPLQVEYIYPPAKIRPKLAFGIDIFKPFFQSVNFMGGVNIKLNEMIYWSVNYNINFSSDNKLPLLPEKLFSNSLSTGIYIAL